MTEANHTLSREEISLANWRESPQSQFSFHNVREFIGTQAVRKSSQPRDLKFQPLNPNDLASIIGQSDLDHWLSASDTDAFVIIKNGVLVCDWRSGYYLSNQPHIVFSVSKSITGMLAGKIQDLGYLDPTKRVQDYLPESHRSGYANCNIQHLLDMQAEIDFNEDYLDQSGTFADYRSATGWNPSTASTKAFKGLAPFLLALKSNGKTHGTLFRYLSPNSDLLGLVLERIMGQRYASLLSDHIWQPLGCAHDAYVTVDAEGTARSAGGICVHPHDLARLGLALIEVDSERSENVISHRWIHDTFNAGNQGAWQQGEFSALLPDGNYRNQWYRTQATGGALLAIGIHGQWLYANPSRQVVIVKLSSQPQPVNDPQDIQLINDFQKLATTL